MGRGAWWLQSVGSQRVGHGWAAEPFPCVKGGSTQQVAAAGEEVSVPPQPGCPGGRITRVHAAQCARADVRVSRPPPPMRPWLAPC